MNVWWETTPGIFRHFCPTHALLACDLLTTLKAEPVFEFELPNMCSDDDCVVVGESRTLHQFDSLPSELQSAAEAYFSEQLGIGSGRRPVLEQPHTPAILHPLSADDAATVQQAIQHAEECPDQRIVALAGIDVDGKGFATLRDSAWLQVRKLFHDFKSPSRTCHS